MKIIVRTFAGFEEILAKEIFQITNLKPEIGKRAVYLEGNLETIYSLNLWSRLALDVLVELHHYKASNEDELYNGAYEFIWDNEFTPLLITLLGIFFVLLVSDRKTTSSISFIVAIPVEIIIGFFVKAIFLIKGISVISKEATLYIGHFNFSKKSTAVSSNGVLKIVIPIFFP